MCMSDVFVISDTHFMHENMYKFLNSDGSKVRLFNSAEECDSLMIQLWNEMVRPKDKVYHLGDVAIPRRGLAVLEALNGKKVLIKGNHDIFKPQDYLKYFKDIRAHHLIAGVILSHVPIHPDSLSRFGFNVHGHTHSNIVTIGGKPDQRYLNVCVEQTGYRPVPLEEIIAAKPTKETAR